VCAAKRERDVPRAHTYNEPDSHTSTESGRLLRCTITIHQTAVTAAAAAALFYLLREKSETEKNMTCKRLTLSYYNKVIDSLYIVAIIISIRMSN
jgi:hypothetical protein